MKQSVTEAWKNLDDHIITLQQKTAKEFFAEDPKRHETFSLSAAHLYLDYSKNCINEKTIAILCNLAKATDLKAWIDKMFSGEKINLSEGRAVLHTALRSQDAEPVLVDGHNVRLDIHSQLLKMRQLVHDIHCGNWKGYSGKSITDIVNIGIGGSDLGPRMAVKALTPYHISQIKVHFVANVDGSDLTETLKNLNPETTLFIIASKSFNTQETLMNATSAKNWLLRNIQERAATAKHFIAISSCEEKAKAFGIAKENVFEMWDWVGGRYSLWSSIGLSIALAIGMDHFEDLLKGAYEMDCHFKNADFSHNMPVLLAMLGILHIQMGCQSHAILPYDEHLQLFPPYLQQADMESNGKSVNRYGEPLNYNTGPIIWGGIGTNGQHAFHQLLHQGKVRIPVDFIIALHNHHNLNNHHNALFANCLAQAQALMLGKSEAQAHAECLKAGLTEAEAKNLAPQKVILGNKPNNILLMEKLTPKTLGALIALYEHKIFTQSIIWNINAFDQWGVELGKQLAEPILKALNNTEHTNQCDSSTANLIQKFKMKNHSNICI